MDPEPSLPPSSIAAPLTSTSAPRLLTWQILSWVDNSTTEGPECFTATSAKSSVYGPSMLPTLNLTGDVVLAEHVSTRLGKVGSGDVVVVRSPENPNKYVTKRIVGMEGDKVTFSVDPISSDRSKTLVVPKGHVWIQGDNVYASKDSRHFGPVPYGLIQGRVCCRIWPPDGFGPLE